MSFGCRLVVTLLALHGAQVQQIDDDGWSRIGDHCQLNRFAEIVRRCLKITAFVAAHGATLQYLTLFNQCR